MNLTKEKVKSLGLDTKAEVVIPKDIKVIEGGFFQNDKIRKIIMNEGLEVIGSDAFYQCGAIKEVAFPASLKRVESWAFIGCCKLKSANFKEGLESIGERAFWECESLEEISLPDSLKEIGKDAFLEVYNLKRIHISKNHKYFGYENNVLYNKKKKSVVAIANTNEGITFPEYIKAIPQDIFKNPNLSKVVFENKDYKISEKKCFSKGVNESIRAHLKGYMLNEAKKEKVAEIMSVSFEDTLQEIATKHALECSLQTQQCDETKIVCILKIEKHTKILTTIKIKNPTFKEQFESFVKLVADKQSTFESLQNFSKKNKDISFNKALALHSCIPFVKLSQKDKEFLSLGLENLRVKIPQGTEAIPEKAFYKLKSLTFVELNDDLKVIDNLAFFYCTSLSEITIPNGVTTIGNQAFYNTNITQMHLPDSITKIEYSAFAECNSLKEIKLPKNLKKIEGRTFYNAALESITIPESITSIDGDAFGSCSLKVIYGTKDSLAEKLAENKKAKYVEIQE
ncbi:leucine-rich repeat domain-containing protein [Campylobacter coli]|nr:leucine-rich repeat domain-containing protein [Campylobacter coli]